MTQGYYDTETGRQGVDWSGDRPRIIPVDLDERDEAIFTERLAALNEVEGPRVGDFVTFADGVTRQFAYDWGPEEGIQTCDGRGSYYLGKGYVSMSGGLQAPVPYDTLTRTEETREGSVWFFHHDWHRAHNAVTVCIPFRVYTCSLTSKEADHR